LSFAGKCAFKNRNGFVIQVREELRGLGWVLCDLLGEFSTCGAADGILLVVLFRMLTTAASTNLTDVTLGVVCPPLFLGGLKKLSL
jgi:hypothetical protein